MPGPLFLLGGQIAKAGVNRALQARHDRVEQDAAVDDMNDQVDRVDQGGHIDPDTARHLASINRQRTIRKALGVTLVGAIIGGIGFGAWQVRKGMEGLGGSLPHLQTVTEQQVDTALSSVQLSGNVVILEGKGTSTADISSVQQVNAFGQTVDVPQSGRRASANVRADIQVVSKAGAVTLKGVQDPRAAGGWHVEATVDTKGLSAQLANEEVKTSGADDFEQQVVTASIGLNSNGRHDAARQLAENNLRAACSQPLGEASVVAAAEANYVHQEIEQAAKLLQQSDPTGYKILQDMNGQPIHVQFSELSKSGVVLPLPNKVDNHTTHQAVGYTTTVSTSGNTCLESPAAANALGEIKHNAGYVLDQTLPS